MAGSFMVRTPVSALAGMIAGVAGMAWCGNPQRTELRAGSNQFPFAILGTDFHGKQFERKGAMHLQITPALSLEPRRIDIGPPSEPTGMPVSATEAKQADVRLALNHDRIKRISHADPAESRIDIFPGPAQGRTAVADVNYERLRSRSCIGTEVPGSAVLIC